MIGKLYLIPTPIGNLSEISPRIISTIEECDYLACEDTRNTKKLLNILKINKKCVASHKFNEKESSVNIIKDILDGKSIGFLSDAGYPCISDPGAIIVEEAIKNNIVVVPISGPNAFINALVASQLDKSHFIFYGFLPANESQRVKELNKLKEETFTLIFYEAPHRINKTIKDLYKVFGDRKITIARELTKIHEEFIHTTLKEFISNPKEIKGEIVLVVQKAIENEKELGNHCEIEQKIEILLKEGYSKKDISNILSLLYKINKNQIKKILLKNY